MDFSLFFKLYYFYDDEEIDWKFDKFQVICQIVIYASFIFIMYFGMIISIYKNNRFILFGKIVKDV